MVKASALSSDIDVIKEFEELKLKQKLLIESLKRNSDTQQNKLFLEINSKLDFLVKIFTEANNSSEDEEKIDFDAKFNEVFDKFSELSQKVDEKFSQMEERVSEIKIPKIETPKVEIPEVKVENSLSNSTEKDVDNKKTDLPPTPEFETKIDQVQKVDEEKKKKKKWF